MVSSVKRVALAFMSTERSEGTHVDEEPQRLLDPQSSDVPMHSLFAPTEEFRAIDLLEGEELKDLQVDDESLTPPPSPPPSPHSSLPHSSLPHSSLPHLPCDLDTYTLTQLYAEGGTARVYRAFEAHSKQPIAIKLLRRRFHNDSTISKNFRRHGNALEHLDLPFFSKVISSGDSVWGPWWAMEWLEGETLRTLLTRGTHWDGKRLLALISQLCEAILALHQQGMIHGDIKPDNIIYHKNKRTGVETLTLIDLALPLTLHFADDVEAFISDINNTPQSQKESLIDAQRARMNSELMVFGQPVYLAPECLRGEPADSRSDLYSLGVVLFELTTRTLPFGTKVPEVIFDVLQREAPRPAVRQSPWPYPPALDAMISNLLSKRPEDRISSISEVITLLKQMRRSLKDNVDQSATHEYTADYMTEVRVSSTQLDSIKERSGTDPSLIASSVDLVSMDITSSRQTEGDSHRIIESRPRERMMTGVTPVLRSRVRELFMWLTLGASVAYVISLVI